MEVVLAASPMVAEMGRRCQRKKQPCSSQAAGSDFCSNFTVDTQHAAWPPVSRWRLVLAQLN